MLLCCSACAPVYASAGTLGLSERRQTSPVCAAGLTPWCPRTQGDSPDFLNGLDEQANRDTQLKALGIFVVSGPKGSSSPDLQERDEFWRTLSCAALGQKAALLYHTHEDKMKIKGALGENGEAGKQLSIGRATLQPGHTVEMLLGGKPWLQVPIKVCLPGEKGETEMEVIVCKREDVQETPYFKEQRWTEEEADGMSRLELYSGVPFTIQPTDFYITANQQVLQYEMRKYRGNQDVTVEHSRLLMNNNGKGYVRTLFIMASPTGFGDLPGSVKLHNGDLKNKCEVELQYASIKPRHRYVFTYLLPTHIVGGARSTYFVGYLLMYLTLMQVLHWRQTRRVLHSDLGARRGPGVLRQEQRLQQQVCQGTCQPELEGRSVGRAARGRARVPAARGAAAVDDATGSTGGADAPWQPRARRTDAPRPRKAPGRGRGLAAGPASPARRAHAEVMFCLFACEVCLRWAPMPIAGAHATGLIKQNVKLLNICKYIAATVCNCPLKKLAGPVGRGILNAMFILNTGICTRGKLRYIVCLIGKSIVHYNCEGWMRVSLLSLPILEVPARGRPGTVSIVILRKISRTTQACPAYVWSLTHRAWNALIKALHGNTVRAASQSRHGGTPNATEPDDWPARLSADQAVPVVAAGQPDLWAQPLPAPRLQGEGAIRMSSLRRRMGRVRRCGMRAARGAATRWERRVWAWCALPLAARKRRVAWRRRRSRWRR